jgi:hypothetical protein
MKLSSGEIGALENLERKLAGEDVAWISIADARALSELGLAERNRAGWNITSAGQTWLRERATAPAEDCPVSLASTRSERQT